MGECQLALDFMTCEIKDIWRACFTGYDEELDLFYEKLFRTDNTIVYTVQGRPVSSLYLLDASIIQDGREIPGYYIYGAGTLPEHRKKGYMERLLMYAETLCESRKRFFLSLEPAEESLYSFYGRRGFKKFFKARRVVLSANDMKKLSSEKQNLKTDFTLDDIYEVRKKVFNREGDVVWKKSHVDYALNLNNLYGGKVCFAGSSYAFCTRNKDQVEISEFAVSNKDLGDIIYQIHEWGNVDKYVFRLPSYSNTFEKTGSIDFLGMIKPIKMDNISYEGSPYLGLGFD